PRQREADRLGSAPASIARDRRTLDRRRVGTARRTRGEWGRPPRVLIENGNGAQSAPAQGAERGAGPPRATEPGCGAEPHMESTRGPPSTGVSSTEESASPFNASFILRSSSKHYYPRRG